MKKKVLLVLITIFSISLSDRLIACTGYDPEYEYYNLFMQELISDPQYYPFLLTYYAGFYEPSDSTKVENENIQQWAKYLGVGYNDAFYLTYKAKQSDLANLIRGKQVVDSRLSFANESFVGHYKQALLYLSYVKTLEPYMTIHTGKTDSWSYRPDTTIANLNRKKVENVLLKSWSIEKDKELKLRYGYQLVRLAHYSLNYKQAIIYFHKYVESLNYKPALYYYALSQKAGAEKGLKMYNAANYDFMRVFSHSADLKQSAFLSIRIGKNPDINNLLQRCKSQDERNNTYLLLGYSQFNNPLPSIQKIVASTPDAIQAKVLMARAINSIEREINRTGYGLSNEAFVGLKDKRYPVLLGKETTLFLDKLALFSRTMSDGGLVKDLNFWNLTSAYLNFLKKDFATAQQYLTKINVKNNLYATQKQNLEMLIDICEQPQIDDNVEKAFFAKYKSIFHIENDSQVKSRTVEFITDVLANRYYLQKDYAKSFLMNNDLTALESNPNLQMLEAIEQFVKKPNKNGFEQMLLDSMSRATSVYDYHIKVTDPVSYINNLRGTVYLASGDFESASRVFRQVKDNFKQFDLAKDTINDEWHTWPKTKFDGYSGIPKQIFGLNIIEKFSGKQDSIMHSDYIAEFPFIKQMMNKRELALALIELQNLSNRNDDLSAKAAFLIGNFLYNTTSCGYYRNVLRFDQDNSFYEKYRAFQNIDLFNSIYLKYYGLVFLYQNNVSLSQLYLQKAETKTTDVELKSRIIFALSKCEQDLHFEKLAANNSFFWLESKDILIKNRRYFRELCRYRQTNFYREVQSNCLYFNYYTKHY